LRRVGSRTSLVLGSDRIVSYRIGSDRIGTERNPIEGTVTD